MNGARLDLRVVERHLVALETSVAALRQFKGKTAAQLTADTVLRWTVERGLHLAAQNALDVATHICSARGLDTRDYASAVDGLAALGVLPAEFAAGFRRMAGFRNVLVHGYLDVDVNVVAEVLNKHLEDFHQFAAHVRAALAQPGSR